MRLTRDRLPAGLHLEDAPAWIALYGVTFALQVIPAVARMLVAATAGAVLAAILGWPVDSTASWVGIAAGLAPFAVSLLTLVVPHALLWPSSVGARRPSEREQAAIDEVLAQLRASGPPFRSPRAWYVLDTPSANACVYGDVVALHRALFETPWFEPTIAHELGHLNTPDGRVTAAVNRLTFPLVAPGATRIGRIRHFLSGQTMMRIVGPAWAAWFRQREYAADQYAARLGQADALIECFETGRIDDRPIPFIWISQHTHPPSELRIERLQQSMAADAKNRAVA